MSDKRDDESVINSAGGILRFALLVSLTMTAGNGITHCSINLNLELIALNVPVRLILLLLLLIHQIYIIIFTIFE